MHFFHVLIERFENTRAKCSFGFSVDKLELNCEILTKVTFKCQFISKFHVSFVIDTIWKLRWPTLIFF